MNKIKFLILALLCCVGSSAWGATGDVVTTIADGNYLIMCPKTNYCAYYYDSNLRKAPNNYLNLSSDAQFTLKKGTGDYSEFYTIQLSDGTFVTYSSTSGNSITFSDSNNATDANKWWSIRVSNDGGTEYDIIPKQDNITTSTPGWNFSKTIDGVGANQAVGFYNASDGNSTWIFISAIESSPAPEGGVFDANTKWYTLTNHTSKYYLNYVADATSMALNTTTTKYEDKDLFCFVGNSTDGYCIYNKAAGSGYLLSSASSTFDGNSGGNTYAIMTTEATATSEGHSYLWDLTKGNTIDSKVGFYIGQHNNNDGKNRLNNRSYKLAYWNGGADAGSTFLATDVKYSLSDLKAGQVIRLHNSARGNTDKSVSNNNHQLSGSAFSDTDAKQLWLVETGTESNTFLLRSLYDGQYIKAGASASNRWTTATLADSPTELYFHSFGNSVSFTKDNNTGNNASGMHLDGSSNIVSWAATADASKWTMDFVDQGANYDIYSIVITGYEGSSIPKITAKTAPVGNSELANGEAFFYNKGTLSGLTDENVTTYFSATSIAGYDYTLSYSSNTITATYEATKPMYTITYNYLLNGVKKAEETFTNILEGDNYPSPTYSFPFAVTASAPSGTVTENITKNIEVTLTDNHPKFADSFGNITTWYYWNMHSNQNYYLRVTDDEGTILGGSQNGPVIEPKSSLWAFVGNPFDGFSIVNYQAGEGYSVDGSNPCKLVNNTDTKFKFYTSDANSSRFCMKTGNQEYVNIQNNNGSMKLLRWSAKDAGSTIKLTEGKLYNLTIASSGLSSLCLPFNAFVPENTYAYYASAYADGNVTLTKVADGKIAANAGYLIKGEKETQPTVTFFQTPDAVTAPETNYLVGVTEATEITKENCYILKSGIFHPVNTAGGNLAANKAYLDLSSSDVKLNGVYFEDGEATGIYDAAKSEQSGVQNGLYNLSGQAVGNDYKGIVIKNGKKYFNK